VAGCDNRLEVRVRDPARRARRASACPRA
jgi:hypothetical protein